MPSGRETTEFREAMRAYFNRKDGTHNENRRLTEVSREEEALLANLPDGELIADQNADGSWPYMPGMDGPLF
jgi:hypothetical protein